MLNDFEVYVDGGIRRGSDVLKALALGAKGVGLGRPFLYAQAAYGDQGVIRAVRSESSAARSGKAMGAHHIGSHHSSRERDCHRNEATRSQIDQ